MTDDEKLTVAAMSLEMDDLRAEVFVLTQQISNLENELDEAWRCRDGDDY